MVPRENCRKVSKNFLTLFDDFWRFLPCAKIVEKCRKTFWHFLTIFDVFWRGPFPPAPFAIRWRKVQFIGLCRTRFAIITKNAPKGSIYTGPGTTQNLVVKFDGEICGGVLVENASDDFPQQEKLENLLPNFAGSSPPISPKTSPTSLWKSLVLIYRSLPDPICNRYKKCAWRIYL